MSVHLVGGGWSATNDPAVYTAFLAEAAERATAQGHSGPARIAVFSVRDGDSAEHAAKLIAAAGSTGEWEPVVTAISFGDEAELSALAGVHGVMVGGGVTPEYLASLRPLFGEFRRLVADGVPYLGFSAGSMIAAESAMIGGWRVGAVEVGSQDASQYLDEVTIENGIGLIDITIEVHAVQWGSLSRLIAAVEAGLVDGGIAIDENTAFIVGEGALRVAGSGSVWRVSPSESGVIVSSLAATA